MAKNIRITRKELLKEPDQFLSSTDKVISFITRNRSLVIRSIVGFLLVGLSFFVYQSYQESKMMKFEALYFNMEEIIRNSEKKGTNPQNQLVKIRDQIDQGPHRNRASLLLADIYYQYKELEKAQSTYHEVKINSTGLNYDMANIGLAYIYEAKKEYKKAIDLFKLTIDSESNFPLFHVYWSLARCHEMNKDKSNALLILREMQIKFSSTAELEKIDKKIQQLST